MSDREPSSIEIASTPATAGPVTGAERIASLDIIRGVSILGILVMNIYAFAMPFSAYSNPLLMGGTDVLNLGTWFVTHILFDQKFLSVFALLFGAGIILMTDRVQAAGAKFGRIFYRRQLFMMLFGAIHAYFIWFGDILFMYAAVGMLAYLFRNLRPRALNIVACFLLPVTLLLSYGMGSQVEKTKMEVAEAAELQEAGEALTTAQEKLLEEWKGMRTFMAPDSEAVQKDVEIHQGGYVDITVHRIPTAAMMQIFGFFSFGLWRVLALMLFGMALMKTGVLRAERTTGFYRQMMLICYGIGISLTVFSAIDLNAHAYESTYAMRNGGLANYFGSIIVGLGHVGLILLLIKTGFVRCLLDRFAAVGRMALTNYLMHSIILTTVFYGYGLGLYGEIPRFWQMGFVVAVITLQLGLSAWWLARYRFGPVEWLWRSLTYWQRQPMRR